MVAAKETAVKRKTKADDFSSVRHSSGFRLRSLIRSPFCLLLLAFLIAFLCADTVWRYKSLEAVTAVKTNEVPIEASRYSSEAKPHSIILPPSTMDGRWWVLHTENFLKQRDSWRVRSTTLDNAPEGREVHWSSSIVWILAILAKIYGSVTGHPANQSIDVAAFWVGPFTLLFSLILLGWLASLRFGHLPTILFLLIFSVCPTIYQAFRAGETDHHGLVCTFIAASILSLVAGGSGLLYRKNSPYAFFPSSLENARNWFRLSGFFGAAALWISAASFIPILASCGLAGVGAFLIRDRTVAKAEPELWRSWARAGFWGCLFFYLLEYFPSHMGLRLEVNNPLYALAWLGAGDLLARWITFLKGGKPFPKGRMSIFFAGISIFFVLLPLGLIKFAPSEFFLVSDRFLLLLHNQFIQEFQSLSKAFSEGNCIAICIEWFALPLFAIAGTFILFRSGDLKGPWLPALLTVATPALLMQALAIWQIRWSMPALALWAAYALVLLDAAFRSKSLKTILTLFAICFMVTCSPLIFSVISTLFRNTSEESLPKSVIPTIIARDLSHRLLQASPDDLPTVLTGPTTSTELNYYGGIRTLGTLYWENLEGLKRAALIFAAPDEATFRKLIEQAGITHILVSTWDNFGKAYVDLLREAGFSVPENSGTYLARLLTNQVSPNWIRPLYYPIPKGFDIQNEELRLFAVLHNQTPAESLLHQGIYAFDSGNFPLAKELFQQADTLSPLNPKLQSWISETNKKLKK
jgi:hypothetical protein